MPHLSVLSKRKHTYMNMSCYYM